MSLLLRKDRPWVVGFATSGGATIVVALSMSAEKAFGVGADRLEEPFHVAWAGGLLLGGVAACFDEILGTREFLAQRPLPRSRPFAARLFGVLAVLCVWLFAAPLFTFGIALLRDPGLVRFDPSLFVPIVATLVVAVSSAAIGFAAGVLPAPWWQRLIAAGAWFGAAFGCVHALSRGPNGQIGLPGYVVGHVLVAVTMFLVARSASRHGADPDRPWPAPLRRAVLLPVVGALALLLAAALREMQSEAIHALELQYPKVARRNGEFVLFKSIGQGNSRLRFDAEHRPTGEEWKPQGDEDVWWGRQWQWYGSGFFFEEPRWCASTNRTRIETGWVMLAGNGAAFVRSFEGSLRETGRGPEHAPFGPDSTIDEVGDAVVAVDAATGEVWRFDPTVGHFVRVAVPDGERCERIESAYFGDSAEDRAARKSMFPDSSGSNGSDGFVRGRSGGYTVRGGALVLVPGLLERADRRRAERWSGPVVETDPLVFTLELPADGSPVTFRHEFRPRTATEWLQAGNAVLLSLLRPTVLQVAGNFVAMPDRTGWMFDRLTVDGRRPWLVFLGCLVVGVAAWRFGRRLHALGADRATQWWWRAVIVLFGPVAVLVGLVIERPRRHARRSQSAPASPPRIVTPLESQESVA